VPSTSVFSSHALQRHAPAIALHAAAVPFKDAAVRSIESFLKQYGVEQGHLGRVAESIVRSAKKYNLDPRLIASIIIVESRANPFAISGKDSIGLMQIHIPTWGRTADNEGVNLFKIEDNIDFGARILRDYIRRSGLWDGVR
jgi:soluble lytic murein transglycosylase-like protein